MPLPKLTNQVQLANQAVPESSLGVRNRRVVLVGASIRWAAQSAARAGYRVFGMDLFGDLDAQAACEDFHLITSEERSSSQKLEQTIRKFAAAEHADVFHVGGLQASIDAKFHAGPARDPFSHAPPRYPSSAISPLDLQRFAAAGDFRFPETYLSFEQRQPNSGRWLVKNFNSTGGMGVKFIEPSWPSADSPACSYLQKWIPGRAFGLVALASRDGVQLLGITRSIHQRLGRLPFVYAGSRTIDDLSWLPWRKMRGLAQSIAEQRSLLGLFNLDWICDSQGQWWLLEVNQRPSSSCEVIEAIALRTGVLSKPSLMQRHIAAIKSGLPLAWPDVESSPKDVPRCPAFIKRIIYSRRDGHVHLSRLPAVWQTSPALSDRRTTGMSIHIADRPAEGAAIGRGQPIATLLLSTEPGAHRLAKTLRWTVRKIQNTVISSRRPNNFSE